MAENKLTGEQQSDVERRLRNIQDDVAELRERVEENADVLELIGLAAEMLAKADILLGNLEELI